MGEWTTQVQKVVKYDLRIPPLGHQYLGETRRELEAEIEGVFDDTDCTCAIARVRAAPTWYSHRRIHTPRDIERARREGLRITAMTGWRSGPASSVSEPFRDEIERALGVGGTPFHRHGNCDRAFLYCMGMTIPLEGTSRTVVEGHSNASTLRFFGHGGFDAHYYVEFKFKLEFLVDFYRVLEIFGAPKHVGEYGSADLRDDDGHWRTIAERDLHEPWRPAAQDWPTPTSSCAADTWVSRTPS